MTYDSLENEPRQWESAGVSAIRHCHSSNWVKCSQTAADVCQHGNPVENREGWAKMLSLLLTGKPFQFPHPKFFNHLIAQVHPPLPVLLIPQIPEIFGLLSGLDFVPCTQGSMDIRTSPT